MNWRPIALGAVGGLISAVITDLDAYSKALDAWKFATGNDPRPVFRMDLALPRAIKGLLSGALAGAGYDAIT